MNKIDIEKTLHNFKISLAPKTDVGGLYARSNIAHKWKLTYRLIVVREGICWRLVDILEQAFYMGQNNMLVGARILTRAGLETLCFLIYMNRKTQQVVENKLSFNDFEGLTRRFIIGAKNNPKMPEPINVSKYIQESEQKYKGIERIYNDLSETAHPNYEGISQGYTKLKREEFETEFGVFWEELFGNQHEIAIELCLSIFEHEYNEVWPEWYKKLEKWLEKNDSKLERERRKKAAIN